MHHAEFIKVHKTSGIQNGEKSSVDDELRHFKWFLGPEICVKHFPLYSQKDLHVPEKK